MSTYQSSGKASTKGLRIALFVVIALFVAVALVLGLCLNKKTELVVTPENNVKTENLNTGALLSNDGWNENLALGLYRSLYGAGDNIALGNAGGVKSAKLISLGGYDWSVVYKQNGIVTLYAEEPVAYLRYDDDSANYVESAVRAYLNGEFYADFVQKIGFSNFENMIVPYGASELYYQLDGAQAVPLTTVYNEEIGSCDGVKDDKIWLPSAYEVGGFASTEKSPKARVNSFKTIKSDALSINSGLWNISNDTRLKVNDAVLRSSANDGVCVLKNGVVVAGNVQNTYAIRPCFNIMMPEVVDGAVLNASDMQYVSNGALFASTTPNFSGILSEYATENPTKTFTAKSGNVTVDGKTYTNSQMMLYQLAEAVNLGANMSGYTFKLSSDVDMSVFTIWSPIGRVDFPFSGTFDGQGYKISNLCSGGSGFVGLFGCVAGTVKNVAVVDSSWYTTNDNVGSITGILNSGGNIEICYSESGISGKNCVGGIVGKSVATSTIKNCYNKSGISGIDKVGGIIGHNNGTTVSNTYNLGAVTGNGSNFGAIVGYNQSGSYSNVVYNNENASSGSITGVTGATYAAMQGLKTSSAVTKPSSMSGWTFNGSPWMISAAENDRLPILKTFLKNPTITVRSADSLNKVSINDSSNYSSEATTSTAVNNYFVVRARSSFSGTNHYRLKQWTLCSKSVGGAIVSTGVKFADKTDGTASGNYRIFDLTLSADDSYIIEAEFEKLYQWNHSPIFNGFANTIASLTGEIGLSSSVGGYAGYWYPKGATITATYTETTSRCWDFAGFKGSSDGGTTWTDIAIGEANSTAFIRKGSSSNQYLITMGHETGFVNNDSYTFRPVFNRYYNVTISNDIPTISGAPAIVTKMQISNPSSTVKSNDTTPKAKLTYNGTLSASIDTAESSWSNYYTFTKWQLSGGSNNDIASNTNKSASSISIPSSYKPADSVSNLTLKAIFAKSQKTVTVTEKVGSTANSNAGLVYLDTGSGLTSITQDKTSLTVDYGTTVYVYILPSYSAGYAFKSFGGSTTQPTTVGTAGLLRTSITVTETKSYDLVYELASKFNITFSAKLDQSSAGSITFNPTKYENKPINTDLSSAKVNITGNVVLTSVTATYNGETKTVKSYTRPSGGYVAQTSNNVFDGLSTKTIAGLLSHIGSPAVYNKYDITVEANFISIVRTITVTEVWKAKTPNGTETTLTGKSKAYTIKDATTDKDVTGQGTLQNDHQVTATPGKGFKVENIIATGVQVTGFTAGTWNQARTADFTLSDNISITITYIARTYTITAQDNISNGTGTVNSGYTFKIGSTTATPATGNKLYVNYGETATISGYAILKAASTTGQKYELRSIGVSAGTAPTTVTQEWSKTCTDENDNITVTFNYVILQKVTITVNDATSTTTSANKVLIVLKSATSGSPNLVVLATKGSPLTYENCMLNSQYTISAVVPVYVSGTVKVGSTQTASITVANGSSITVELQQAMDNGNVYSSEYFG